MPAIDHDRLPEIPGCAACANPFAAWPTGQFTACRECDMLVRIPLWRTERTSALCPRCGALLHRGGGSLETILALACAALILLAIANAFPVVGLDIQGQRIDATVFGAARQLWREEMPAVALLVLTTTSLIPLLEIAALIWLTLPLLHGRRPRGFAQVFRALQAAHPWTMVEVFILGILVALVKLAHLADVVPGPAMLGFALLMPVLVTVSSLIEPYNLWQAWEEAQA